MTTVNATVSEKGLKNHYKVGIPRGLFFYRYFPLWKDFLSHLNCEIVTSPPTTTKLVEEGSKEALSELCVPMKIYYGHVLALIQENPDLDFIFIPRYVSTHKECFFCPKFLILPEAIKYGLNPKIPIIILDVNAKAHQGIEGAIELGKKLGFSQEEAGKAWYFAVEKYKLFQEKGRKGNNWLDMINSLDENPKHKRSKKVIKQQVSEAIRGKFPLRILMLGHAYNIYENYINMDMQIRLEAMDCHVVTMEQLPEAIFEKPVLINKQYHNYWENEDEILKTARYFLRDGRDEIDGIIFLISFACGPDSLIQELVMRDTKKMNIPYLSLILDEHSGEGGMVTRIESFVDMVRREKYGEMM